MSLPARLRATREAIGLTQEAVSRISGIAAPNLSKIENGGSDIQISTLMRILDAMNLDIEFVPRDAPISLQDVIAQSERGRKRLNSKGIAPSDPQARLSAKRARGLDVSVEQSLLTRSA
ncbi:MAG: helix-turn-helix transcriptional regulator [Acidimicrobiia bacterium]|nr:MAG: helix-turn-helix transcriptional regulator [Acidimicrobiia bacterium]